MTTPTKRTRKPRPSVSLEKRMEKASKEMEEMGLRYYSKGGMAKFFACFEMQAILLRHLKGGK